MLCFLVVVFSIPRKLLKFSRFLSLSLSLSLSECVIWKGVTWEYKANARALPLTNDSRLGLETALLRRYFTKDTSVYSLLT